MYDKLVYLLYNRKLYLNNLQLIYMPFDNYAPVNLSGRLSINELYKSTQNIVY